MGGSTGKAFQLLGGKPMAVYALRTLSRVAGVRSIAIGRASIARRRGGCLRRGAGGVEQRPVACRQAHLAKDAGRAYAGRHTGGRLAPGIAAASDFNANWHRFDLVWFDLAWFDLALV